MIRYTLKLAKNMGCRAVLIYGDPEYYKRFGFVESKKYNITNKDGKYPAALLVLELFPNVLKGIEGKYDEGDIYKFGQAEFETFDKSFPVKEKGKAKTQERFLELVGKFL